MKPDLDTQAVKSRLQGLGFAVGEIPESADYPTPDLRLSDSSGDILIEGKAKTDDQQLRQLLDSPAGTPLPGPASSLRQRIRDAWHQIRYFPGRTGADPAVVWLVTRKPHGMTVLTALHALPLLYGTELLEGYDTRDTFYERPCFFFRSGLFQHYTDLVALVLQNDQDLTLCLNSLCPRYAQFRATEFASAFLTHFAVIDPAQMEAAGTCFISHEASSPLTTAEKVVHLRSKYGLDTVTLLRFVLLNAPVQ